MVTKYKKMHACIATTTNETSLKLNQLIMLIQKQQTAGNCLEKFAFF